MPMGKLLADSEVAQIRQFHTAGLSLRDIARKVGRSRCAVSNVLRAGDKYGAKSPFCGRKPKLSPREVQLARDWAAHGKKSIREIQRQLPTAVCVSTVFKAITKNKYGMSAKDSEDRKTEKRLQCFFCLSCEPDHFKRGSITGRRSQGVNDPRLIILLKYLLSTKNDRNDPLLQDIIQILEGKDNNTGTVVCDRCGEESQRIADLHQELEVIQMKIVERLKLFRGNILQRHFVNGSSKVELDRILRGVVLPTLDYSATESETPNVLEVIADFQMAVHEKGKSAVDLPCVILDRFAFSSDRSSDTVILTDLPEFSVTVKTEVDGNTPGQDDDLEGFPGDLDNDMEPVDLEVDIDKEPSPSVTIATPVAPKLNLKRKFLDAEKIFRGSHGDCKLEDEEPPQRSRRTGPLLRTPAGADNDPPLSSGHKQYKRRKVKKKNHEATAPLKKVRIRHKMTCDLCPYSNKTSFPFEHHLLSHEALLRSQADQPAPHTCDLCSQSFFSPQLLAFHVQGHSGKFFIRCDSCQERIPYPEIEAHVRTHTDKIFSCVNCSFRCTTREKYLLHLKYHGKGRLECDLCSKPYRTKVKLFQHLFEGHQVGQKYVCPGENCKKEFFSRAHFNIHSYIHTNPHECPDCGKVYGDRGKLKLHQQVHHTTAGKVSLCPECPESFTSAYSLHSHRILAHGAEKYKCEYCEKEYMSSGMLRLHLTTHEGTGLPCGKCDKVLASKALWRRHQIVHTTELRFVCEECGKGFTSQQGLKKHSAIHGGEKRFKCQFCEKSFLFFNYLADHERIHTGERPFTCDVCGKGFSQRGSVYLHKKTAHGRNRKSSREPVNLIPGAGNLDPEQESEEVRSLLAKKENAKME